MRKPGTVLRFEWNPSPSRLIVLRDEAYTTGFPGGYQHMVRCGLNAKLSIVEYSDRWIEATDETGNDNEAIGI